MPIPKRSRAAVAMLWVCQLLAAAAFLSAGGAKLAGAGPMVQLFETIGFGQWFRYVTGSIEVVSALLLLAPRFAAVGAVLLACTMLGAIAAHLLVLHTSPLQPIVLLVLVTDIAWFRRQDIG